MLDPRPYAHREAYPPAERDANPIWPIFGTFFAKPARPRSDRPCPQGGVIPAAGIIGFLCTPSYDTSLPVRKRAAWHRAGVVRTSENLYKAKFANPAFIPPRWARVPGCRFRARGIMRR